MLIIGGQNVSSAKEKNDWLHSPHFPVMYTQPYAQIAQERGVSSADLLRAADIKASVFNDPNGRLSVFEYGRLISTVIELAGDHGLGLEVGLRTPPTAHGSLGYALLCSGSLAEAAQVLQRFRHLRGRGMLFKFNEGDIWYTVEFQAEFPLSGTLRRVMFDALIMSFYRAVQILMPDANNSGELWFEHSKPDYFEQFRERLPPVHYDMPTNQARITADLIHRPLMMSNPSAFKLAVAQCEREDAMFGGGEAAALERVRSEMVLTANGYPTQEQLANKLHMSPRTFRRKLQLYGINYKQILEDARRRDALMLLNKAELEIQKVAELLGYTNPANFTRAFRDWTGRAPSQYRELRKSSAMDV